MRYLRFRAIAEFSGILPSYVFRGCIRLRRHLIRRELIDLLIETGRRWLSAIPCHRGFEMRSLWQADLRTNTCRG